MRRNLVTAKVIVYTDEEETWEDAEAWVEWAFEQPAGRFTVVGVKWEETLEDADD